MKRSGWIVVVALGVCNAAAARGAPYTFTRITDNISQYGTFRHPVVNNGGVVAAVAILRPSGAAVVTITGSQVTQLADTSDPRFAMGFDSVAINASGWVVFSVVTGVRQVDIYAATTKQPPILIAQQATADLGIGIAINESGIVAWSTPTAVLKRSVFGGPVITVSASEDGYFYAYGDVAINASGAVAFAAKRLDNNYNGLYITNGDVTDITTIVETPPASPPNTGGYSGISMNDLGQVAFTGPSVVGATLAVFLWDSMAVTRISIEYEYHARILGPTAINNAGRVVFKTYRDSSLSTSGIYRGIGDPVFEDGDAVFPGLPASIGFLYERFSKGLNDAGQVAFVATVNTPFERATAILLATPAP